MDSVGAYEAKTHLPRLLRRVMEGESLTITRHGRPVARLVPVEADERARAYEAARRIRESRRRLKNKASLEELLETIHEGHRY
ncbi:MAG: type II toxin-antitoxin system Phd/YefM family antitoxin [Gemmatimonadales bacterium]|nr:type II toxin-antitoxin system Phd/YefM family antitoxin [Gemmatimonadales bacterium]MYG48772.1 type II toxin-antitoxin system Phd/YefM family antitoxin [Gemmatimonadales bacterium]MYK03324.1 type II toxin-antitoxin system Phd/YefM family antitoxin [Candidatus Palauibacter ramosifaciens]